MAIGGGSFQQGETRELDAYIIKKVAKPKPKVVFLPTAARDDQGYAKRFKQYYRSLGCDVEALRLLHTKLSHEQIEDKLTHCDILYIGGGNFTFLVKTIMDKKLERVFFEAYTKGVICVGYSAGASLFYTYGYSDLQDDGSSYGYVKGLDFIHGIFCPHAQQMRRQDFLKDDVFDDLPRYACTDGTAYITEMESTRPFYDGEQCDES